MVDELDKKIIELLQKNGRMKLKEIAKKLEIPITTAHKRLKKLINEEWIKITALPDLEKFGYGIKAIILINVDTSARQVNQEELAKKLLAIPQILEAYIVTGSKDIVVKAVCKSIKELKEIVLEKLRSLEGVANTETLVVLWEGSRIPKLE